MYVPIWFSGGRAKYSNSKLIACASDQRAGPHSARLTTCLSDRLTAASVHQLADRGQPVTLLGPRHGTDQRAGNGHTEPVKWPLGGPSRSTVRWATVSPEVRLGGTGTDRDQTLNY